MYRALDWVLYKILAYISYMQCFPIQAALIAVTGFNPTLFPFNNYLEKAIDFPKIFESTPQ